MVVFLPFITKEKRYMKQKTYGVNGLMEWSPIVTIAKRSITLHFTGGTASGTGIRPATFRTNNAIVQLAIENSYHFKSGRIFIVDEKELDDPQKLVQMEADSTQGVNDEHSDDGVTIEVSGLEEAVDYLTARFDDAANAKLNSKKSVLAFAKSKGVIFKGLK